MYIYIYIHTYIYACVYVCMYVCVCVCMYIYIYIYTHIHTLYISSRFEASPPCPCSNPACTGGVRKGTNGVSTNGVTADLMFFDRGFFGYSRSPTFIFPKVPGRTFFPHLSNCLLLQRPR